MSQGTLSLTNGSKDVTGTGTAFTSDTEAGGWLIFHVGGMPFTVAVESVQSDTALTMADNFDGATATGIGYNGVPLSALIQIPALTSIQARDAIRRMMMNDANFQQLLTGPDDVTINRPDGSTFSGPSWPKIVELLNGLDIDQITALADQISDDADQVSSDKAAAEAAKTSAESSATSAGASKVDAANAASYANSRATASEASAVRAEAAAESLDTTNFVRKDQPEAGRDALVVYSRQEVDAAIAAGGGASALLKANNLSDLPDKSTARANLGLGTAAVANTGGAVSMDGDGRPNGAILEHGNNANGRYTKFADGTMICWFTSATSVTVNVASGSLYRSGSQSMTFPAAFISTPTVTPSVKRTGAAEIAWGVIADPTATTVSILGYSGASTTVNVGYTAIGRWV